MSVTVHVGDCRDVLPKLAAESVHCCVTSPPYWGLRDYGCDGQIGIEASVAEYVAELVGVFREVRRVLRPNGTLWLNLGDCYASDTKGSGGAGKSGLRRDGREETRRILSADETNSRAKFPPRKLIHGIKPKDLIGLPWRVAFALQADGWWLRSDIIWAKPNPMPESVRDRPTRSHEYVFLLSKSAAYHFDADAVREPAVINPDGRAKYTTPSGRKHPGERNDAAGLTSIGYGADPAGRNVRSVWTIAPQPFREAHFATFPPALAERCIKAGCPAGGTVLDPFGGAGTTGLVANRLQCHSVLVELNPAYGEMARRRLAREAPLLAEVAA